MVEERGATRPCGDCYHNNHYNDDMDHHRQWQIYPGSEEGLISLVFFFLLLLYFFFLNMEGGGLGGYPLILGGR